MARLLSVFLFCGFVTSINLAVAGGVPRIDLPELCERADLVVVGKVTDRRVEGRTAIQVGSAAVEGTSEVA